MLFAGRWIAQIQDKIIGHDGTSDQTIDSAKATRHKEAPVIHFVAMHKPLVFSPFLNVICSNFPNDTPIYLVGGAVRDLLLARPVHDYDFVLHGNALDISKKIANQLGAAYFPLDLERGTARVICTDENGIRTFLDFNSYRGNDLEEDLKDRDFTINAMALDLRSPQELLDPLGGAADLHAKSLKACSKASFKNDPVRVLRAIRLAANLGLHIELYTRTLMRNAVPGLAKISPERIRDELFRILGGKQPHTSIRALEMLGALPYIFPELPFLIGITQSSPHTKDVWNHTLDTLRILEGITSFLCNPLDPEASGNLMLGLLSSKLGRFRNQISLHLHRELIMDRSIKELLFLTALYHDVAKPQTRKIEKNGETRYFNHDQLGGEVIANRAKVLRLSNIEVDRLSTVVRNHMRPALLSHATDGISNRAIYRFFRDTSDSGIDICLLSLADVWATYGPNLPQERWEKQIDTVFALLKAWWDQPNEIVHPPSLISGKDLINVLNLQPGPIVGDILEAVREAQVENEIIAKSDALIFAKELINKL